jgi:hypothetical protein
MFNFPHRSRPLNVNIGKPETSPTAPAHTPGVKQGNARGNLKKEKGLMPGADGQEGAKASARRSTGINADDREPIDPRMPNLPPA